MGLFNDEQDYIHDARHGELLLARYAEAQKLMDAVALGDGKTACALYDRFMESVWRVNDLYTPEEANPRQTVNRLVSLNAVLHICGFMANVYPLYLHSLSRRFDKRIERVSRCDEEAALSKEMMECYCALIRTSRLERYGDFSSQVIERLLTSLTDPPSLEELARELFVSPATVSRRFKAETGQTIPEFVNRARVRLSKIYMQEGAANLSEIAQSVGFNDGSYFSKVFSRYEGQTPTAYLRQLHALSV